MLDVMDFEKSAMLLIENDLYDMFLDMEVLCITNDFHYFREQLIQAAFVAAIKLN